MRKRRMDTFGFGMDDDWFEAFFGRSFGGFGDMFERMQEMMDGAGLDNENVRHYGFKMTMGPDGIPHVKQWGNFKPGEQGPKIGPRNPDVLKERDCGGGGCGDGSCGSLGHDPDYAEAPGPKLPFPYNPEPNRPGPGPGRMRGRRPGKQSRAGGDLIHEIEETGDGLSVTIELPGVAKKDIQLEIFDDRVLHLKVDSAKKKIDRVIQLPSIVEPDSIKAKANNGILTVVVRTKKGVKKEPSRIDIEW